MNDYFGYIYHRDRTAELERAADAARLAADARRGERATGGLLRRWPVKTLAIGALLVTLIRLFLGDA